MASEDKTAELLQRWKEVASERAIDHVVDAEEAVKEFSESPIETMLAYALLAEAATHYMTSVGDFKGAKIDRGELKYPANEGSRPTAQLVVHGCFSMQFELWQQVSVGKYRADLVAIIKDYHPRHGALPVRILAIECDGHNYHERTKDQARRDRARDRYFTQSGIAFFRFTGSEIYKDAQGCAEQCLLHLDPYFQGRDYQ